MPIWMRMFHIASLNKYHQEQEAEYKKLQGESNIGDGQIQRPNVSPSSTYNFSK
jgi:hypothetical protein